MKYCSVNKPVSCPKCGSKKVVRVLYGEPTYEAFLKEMAGKIVLGGCIVTGNDPAWSCTECHINIYRKISKL